MKYIDEFLEYLLIVKKHSDNTITNYRVDLMEFLDFYGDKLDKVSKSDVFDYLKKMYDDNISKSSIARKLSSLRSFYNYMVYK